MSASASSAVETGKHEANLKVALACDWLTTVGGAESVLLALHEMYPEAPIYTSQYDEKGIDWFKDADVRTGYLQHFPVRLRKILGPLRQRYFSKLDLSDYDLVISVTGAEAKAVKIKSKAVNSPREARSETGKSRTKPEKTEQPEHRCVHLCYCHVPTQYYWGKYDDYLKNPGFGILNPLARLALKIFVKPLRKKDFASAQNPDQFITISNYAAAEIKKYYKRESVIIYPPADLKKFSTGLSTGREIKTEKSQARKTLNYITTSRQVNWKRLDLCVKAALKTGVNLTLIGDGPEHNNLVKIANGAENIRFLPTMPQDRLKKFLVQADAYLFPSCEPFGLAPIEAMACGVPVIALKKGGALDYIKPNINGLFFENQTVTSLAEAIENFEKLKKSDPESFLPDVVKNTTLPFDKKIFKQKIKELIDEKVKK